MLVTTIILGVISLIVSYIAYSRGVHLKGLIVAKNLTLQVLPLLVFAFILAGMLQVLIPTELISRWIGAESGLKGIIIGSLAGGLLPGGPYVSLPIVAGLAKVGASIPVLVSIITGWSLLAVMRLPIEIGILGPRLTLIRLASVLLLAPLAGLIATLIVRLFKIT